MYVIVISVSSIGGLVCIASYRLLACVIAYDCTDNLISLNEMVNKPIAKKSSNNEKNAIGAVANC